jgi:hypothetical protein
VTKGSLLPGRSYAFGGTRAHAIPLPTPQEAMQEPKHPHHGMVTRTGERHGPDGQFRNPTPRAVSSRGDGHRPSGDFSASSDADACDSVLTVAP